MPPIDMLGNAHIRVLGWTLVHFVWQGAGVAALLTVMLAALRRSRPGIRYAVACGFLAIAISVPIATFAFLAPRTGPSSRISYSLDRPADWGARAASSSRGDAPTPRQGSAGPTIEAYLPHLVAVWVIGVLVLSVRMLGGLWLLRRLTARFNRPASVALLTRFGHLSQRLGLRRSVRLRESLAARVPLVIGWLRPVILLPTSAVSGLSIAQLEMILAHELAHVRRHDYLVNLLQHLVETLLFYHPAVWWISAKVREERENCCDDLAVRACGGSRASYAKALVQLDDLNLYRLAPAATSGSLLRRVQRLAGRAPMRPPGPGQWLAGVALLVLPILTMALAGKVHDMTPLLGTYRAEPVTVTELSEVGFSDALACENSGPWVLVFSDLGFFSGNVDAAPGCTYQSPFATSSWTVHGDQLTFRDSRDFGCGLELYRYRYHLDEQTLTLTPVSDPCPVRAYILSARAWRRA